MKSHGWILVPFCLAFAAGCGDGGPGGSAEALTGAATASSASASTAGTAAAPPKPTFKPEAKVASMSGDVKYVRAGAPPAPVANEMEFQAGDTFWIADGATATFNLEDEGTATITGPGVIAMTNNERREWAVVIGRAEFSVKRTVAATRSRSVPSARCFARRECRLPLVRAPSRSPWARTAPPGTPQRKASWRSSTRAQS